MDMKLAEGCEGALISLNSYAVKHGISYQAVAQQVKRYSAELEGHIVKQGKTRYLDETGEAFLDEKRSVLPVTVYAKGEQRQIEEQKDKIVKLQNKIIEVQEKASMYSDALIQAQQKYTALLEEHNSLQKEHTELKLLLEQKQSEAEDSKAKQSEAKPSTATEENQSTTKAEPKPNQEAEANENSRAAEQRSATLEAELNALKLAAEQKPKGFFARLFGI